MSNWADDDQTEFAPLGDRGRPKRNDSRRALLGGVAGVAMLVGPIALANSIIPSVGDGVATEQASSASLIARRAAQGNAQADTAQLKSLAARITTTTTAPPTTTTTAPPTTTTTTRPPMTTPSVPPLPGSGVLGDPNLDASWDKLAQCESGGNWSIVSSNGLYYGGLQFSLSTWRGIGGTGLPSDHPREVQIAMGKKLWQTSGWGAWPACTRELGWR